MFPAYAVLEKLNYDQKRETETADQNYCADMAADILQTLFGENIKFVAPVKVS